MMIDGLVTNPRKGYPAMTIRGAGGASGTLSTIQYRIRNMPAVELIMILALLVGGVGLFLSSLKNTEN